MCGAKMMSLHITVMPVMMMRRWLYSDVSAP